MKKLLILVLFFSIKSWGSAMIECPHGMMRIWTQTVGHQCVPRFNPEPQLPQGCFGPISPLPQNPFSYFPYPLYQPAYQPWWAHQGNFYYPNLNYPGPWSYPGIQQHHYPGSGNVFAAKPNVYVDSIHKNKKFNFKFASSEKISFLATTPFLPKSQTWSGKIVDKDKFELDDTAYDYLFYDVRLPKEKMQFDRGVCTTRSEAIDWMLKDLKEMKYSNLSLQDFEEHWRVKIPDYSYYCIYPQYNAQLDPALPVEIDVDQHSFIRTLYVLVPHKDELDVEKSASEVPFPTKDPSENRPTAKIKREIEFREWGVAFLGY